MTNNNIPGFETEVRRRAGIVQRKHGRDTLGGIRLAACPQCDAPSWQQPCPCCGWYAQGQPPTPQQKARNHVSLVKWCEKVAAHGGVAKWWASHHATSAGYTADPSYTRYVDDLIAAMEGIDEPPAGAVYIFCRNPSEYLNVIFGGAIAKEKAGPDLAQEMDKLARQYFAAKWALMEAERDMRNFAADALGPDWTPIAKNQE